MIECLLHQRGLIAAETKRMSTEEILARWTATVAKSVPSAELGK